MDMKPIRLTWYTGGGDAAERRKAVFAELFKSLLANVAALFPGETLQFDPVACRITNHAQADEELHPHYREGWTL